MRKLVFAVAVAVLSTTALFADELHPGSTSISAYLSDVGYVYSSTSGSSWSGGAGFAVDHAWTNRVSTVLSVGAERRRQFSYHLEPVAGQPSVAVGENARIYTYPIDLMTRYHFVGFSRWTPYVGAGVRYVNAPHVGEPVFGADPNGVYLVSVHQPADRTSAEVNSGVTFSITPRLGLQFDVKQLLRSDSVPFDPNTKASIGVSWRF